MFMSSQDDDEMLGVAASMASEIPQLQAAAKNETKDRSPQVSSCAEEGMARAAELSIIVPTLNERDNIKGVISALERALPNVSWEVVFVDDNSPDGTAELVRQIARVDPRVRCLHRFGRRGLSSGCIEGIMSTASAVVAVMDADGQHDERCLSDMYRILSTTDADMVVGSRYIAGGGVGEWNRGRAAMSRVATRISNWITGNKLSDPMSGFFMIRRDAFLAALPHLSGIGFKILLDIAASSSGPLKIVDIPYQFRLRQHGTSKLDLTVLFEFALLVIDKLIGGYVPTRFVSFAMVGGTGVLVHMFVLTVMFKLLGASFVAGQIVATFAAITSNFLLNNALTYRDQRLKGSNLLLGWLSFNAVCAAGAIANVSVASWMFERQLVWFVSALGGVLMGFVWNYTMSSIFTWRKR